MGNKKAKEENLSNIFEAVFLPKLIKKYKISHEEIDNIHQGMIREEMVRSSLLSIAILFIMVVYYIYGFATNYFFGGNVAGLYFFSAITIMFISSLLYTAYVLIFRNFKMSLHLREAVQFVYYGLITSCIFIWYIGARVDPNDVGNFALAYIWFVALALTPLTYFPYWVIFSILTFAGVVTTVFIFESPAAGNVNFIQYFLVFLTCDFAGLVLRSYSFNSAYVRCHLNIQNEENIFISMTDALTGIENRRGLENYFDLKTPSWITSKAQVSILFFDIDCFKLYNDSFGHIKGDESLKRLTSAILDAFKKNDLNFFRFGGDEFIVVSEDSDPRRVKDLAIKIHEAVYAAEIKAPKGAPYQYLTISMGVKTLTVQADYSYKKHIDQADQLLYKGRETAKGAIDLNGEVIKS